MIHVDGIQLNIVPFFGDAEQGRVAKRDGGEKRAKTLLCAQGFQHAVLEFTDSSKLPSKIVKARVLVLESVEARELLLDGRGHEGTHDIDEINTDLGPDRGEIGFEVVAFNHERQAGHVVIEQRRHAEIAHELRDTSPRQRPCSSANRARNPSPIASGCSEAIIRFEEVREVL